MTMKLKVAPDLPPKLPWYQDDLAAFFSEAMQKAILHPFLQLWSVYHVDICGLVLPKIAANIKDSMNADRWQDPEEMIKASQESRVL